ncbi:outer membrane beta-barrel protein [Flavobacterium suzhouense]|uniref:Outer membrane beta-barrel protein n=1 Tax=Flavobacterium suzhouense TaxID=1529638 RepID=A0ABW5NSP3_9FLAO
MKKLHLLLLLALPLISSAQEEIKYGINAGPTFSAIRGDGYAKDFGYATGYLAGITMEKPLNQRFSLCAAINYENKRSTKKTSYNYTETIIGPDGTGIDQTVTGSSKITTSLDYISVPVTIKYYLDIYESYYVTGGGFIAYAFNDSYTIKGDKPMNTYIQDYKALDYGISLSFGTKFKLTRWQYLNIEVRDNFGVANITSIDSDKITTNSINLIANWQFTL